MLERSDQAPIDWTQEHTQAEVRRVVLDVSPDIVLFQELPGVVPFVETHDMIRSNPLSHSGNMATLVGHDLMDEPPTFVTVPGVGLLTTFVDRDVTVANVHLAPGGAAAAERLEQLEMIIEASPTEDLAIIGDTNTRTDEEESIRRLGLTGTKPPEPTWNGRRNRFRSRSAEFVAYFTRYFVSKGLRIDEPTVLSEPTVIDGHRFHLSDHFALSGLITSAR